MVMNKASFERREDIHSNSSVSYRGVWVGFGFAIVLGGCLYYGSSLSPFHSRLITDPEAIRIQNSNHIETARAQVTKTSTVVTPPRQYDATRCWSTETFGRAISPVDNQEYIMTPSMCEASQTNWGGENMDIPRVADKLFRCVGTKGLVIYALGSSITCGSGPRHPSKHKIHADAPCFTFTKHEQPGCKLDAWPQKLEEAINVHHPCLNMRHKVINQCAGGRGSEYWVQEIAAIRWNVTHPLLSADVILIEAAASDAHLEGDSVQKNTELLVRMLQGLPKKPMLMWITASWHSALCPGSACKDYWLNMGMERPVTAESVHLSVLKKYGIPHLSMLQPMNPWRNSLSRHQFITEVYQTDGIHPTRLAHKMIASVVAHRIAKQSALSLHNYSWFDSQPRPDHVIKPVLIQSAREMESILLITGAAAPSKVELIDPAILLAVRKPSEGFSYYEDVPSKPGLIGIIVGAKATILIPDVKDNNAVQVGLLHSYLHMGTVNISIWTRWKGKEVCSKHPFQTPKLDNPVNFVRNTIIDTLWAKWVSVVVAISLHVPLGANASRFCVYLQFEIVDSQPPRIVNKIKIAEILNF